MRLHVCSLARLHDTVAETGARHVVTLINAATQVRRPASVPAENHLFLGMNDIAAPLDGLVVPGEEHLDRLLDFAGRWDRSTPLIVHCWAGVSRSTAAAYAIACALNPARDEAEAAQTLRRLSPTATPNPRIVALADARLARAGRMVAAIEAIGRGAECFEGTPFAYDI